MRLAPLLAAAALGFTLPASSAAGSGSSQHFCDAQPTLSATQQDRLLRFAAVVKRTLENSGHRLALVARNGTDLRRFGLRYSHAGVALAANANAPWSVRQLYYACDERRPRIFDQGVPGFVMGTDDPDSSRISLVLLPPADEAALEHAALDDRLALRLLAGRYSANAHPSSLDFQNCNQWVIEMIAAAWGGLVDGADLRARAQAWLAAQGYEPSPVQVDSHLLMAVLPLVSLLHTQGHPQEDLLALRVRTSLPEAIEAFVHARVAGARRIELCHDDRRVVIRHGWAPIGEACEAALGDTVVAFD